MFVDQFDIQEFRGIKKCSNPLKFADFTVLVGRNNSGKSSVLEALSLLPVPSQYYLPYYGEDRLQLLSALHGGRSSLVYAYSGTAQLKYMIRGNPRDPRLLKWRINLSERGAPSLFIEGIEGIDEDFIRSNPEAAANKALGLMPKKGRISRDVHRKVVFIPNNTIFMDKLISTIQQEDTQHLVTKLGAHTKVARELINKCVDDTYTELFFAPELSARKELPNGNTLYVKIKDLGAGIEKVALVALWLEALNPTLVLWDDFEGSAHPTLIKTLLEWLSKKKWQVILSTHSIDVLSSLLDVKPRNAKVIQMKKTAGDILIHRDLDLEELENLLEANQDPRILVDLLEL